jgi:hypothetical protein
MIIFFSTVESGVYEYYRRTANPITRQMKNAAMASSPDAAQDPSIPGAAFMNSSNSPDGSSR